MPTVPPSTMMGQSYSILIEGLKMLHQNGATDPLRWVISVLIGPKVHHSGLPNTLFSTLLTYYPGKRKHNYEAITTTIISLITTTVTLVCTGEQIHCAISRLPCSTCVSATASGLQVYKL